MKVNQVKNAGLKPLQSYQGGFTLIEIMVVVVILGVLTALVGQNMFGRVGQARLVAAKADINTISNALQMYKLDNFSYPSTDQGLQALVTKPSGDPEPKNWSEDGYLPKLPSDPWGNSYIYISPGTHGPFDLMSYGSDGREGGDEDVFNWDVKKS